MKAFIPLFYDKFRTKIQNHSRKYTISHDFSCPFIKYKPTAKSSISQKKTFRNLRYKDFFRASPLCNEQKTGRNKAWLFIHTFNHTQLTFDISGVKRVVIKCCTGVVARSHLLLLPFSSHS